MTSQHVRVLLMFLAIAGAAFSVAANLRPSHTASQTQVKCDRACLQAKVDRHLLLMGEFGRDEPVQSSLRDLTSTGPPLVRIIHDTYNHWSRPENYNPKQGVGAAEMRWRAVYLLSSLGIPDAGPLLFEIARRPLPDPRASEIIYADEYRIRLRAIVGLENLKATEELKELHELGGVLRNPTAASLFVLGIKVGRVSRVDARKALAEDIADYKDFKEGKGRQPQKMKPGREKTSPTRRPDTPLTTRQSKGD